MLPRPKRRSTNPVGWWDLAALAGPALAISSVGDVWPAGGRTVVHGREPGPAQLDCHSLGVPFQKGRTSPRPFAFGIPCMGSGGPNELSFPVDSYQSRPSRKWSLLFTVSSKVGAGMTEPMPRDFKFPGR